MALPTKEDLKAQAIIQDLSRRMNMGPPGAIPTTFGSCSQCGIMHPPLRPGEMCPNAKFKTSTGKVIDFEKFLVDLKMILVSQFEIRKVTNSEDIFKQIKLEVMKIMENYKP